MHALMHACMHAHWAEHSHLLCSLCFMFKLVLCVTGE